MDLLKSSEGRLYLIHVLTEYLTENHKRDLQTMAIEWDLEADNSKPLVLRIDVMILLQQYPWISPYLLNEAIKLIKLFNASFTKLFCSYIKENQPTSNKEIPNCFVRITSLPMCDEISRRSIPKSADIGKFLSLSATVVRAGPVQILEFQREYLCKKCKFSILCEFNESDSSFTINPPKFCTNTVSGCVSTSFEPAESSPLSPKFCRNRQEINIQEQIKYLSYGCIPRTMRVVLDDDLVDTVKPGDDVIVNGTVIRRWKPARINEECDIQLVILANEIQIINHSVNGCYALNTEIKQEFQSFWDGFGQKYFTARNAIISQMCPSIYGMYFLKLALALVLSGSENSIFNGMKVRGESHLLLVGDPGTAKSQFLKFAHKITPRSVLTTGIGSTNAGLTVTAVRESSGWSLEAGALVLADGGICCIDEFTSIKECDKVAIHEAMEQQSISVAKAGIVCKLKTRCSIIAATNPKGNYDVTQSITANTSIASPLLSRFDLIFLLLDNCNESWDLCVSDFILKNQTFENSKDSFNVDKLKTYFAFIRTNYHPKMTAEASVILERYYTWMRRSETTNSLDRITMRFLESLIRLSQSHARLMMRDLVKEEDAIVVVAIMESTVYGSSILSVDKQLPSSFPLDAEEEYRNLKNNILPKLSLPCQNVSNYSHEQSVISKHSSSFTHPDASMTSIKRPKLNLNKSVNRSVLDNFHIITQINNNKNNSNNVFDNIVDDIVNETKSPNLIQHAPSKSLSSTPIIINKPVNKVKNIFTDSISGQKELDDDDFDI